MNLSIHRRLLIILLSTISFAWILAALISYLEISDEVSELFDAQLAQAARVLLSVSGHELQEQLMYDPGVQITKDDQLYDDPDHQYEHKIVFQIWIAPDTLAARSKSAPEKRLSKIDNGFSDQIIDGDRWRVYSYYGEGSLFKIQVGENYEIRDELIKSIAFKMMIPILITLPILAVLIWLGIGKAMRPMEQLADQVRQRHPEHLNPIDDSDVPEEAKPLTDSMNTLFQRLKMAFENERRFTADAAHELRTPLAGLKTQAQVALRAIDPEQQKNALEHVVKGVDRTTHLVSQLLTLARLDPEANLPNMQIIDMCSVASEVLADMAQIAWAKNIEIGIGEECSGSIRGSEDALKILLRNLIENAIRHTPSDGHVFIEIAKSHHEVILKVMDSGPGIPEEERDKVFNRFYRVLDNTTEGSGLGLSIVGRIAELHRANISLHSSKLGGLEVRLTFPSSSSE